MLISKFDLTFFSPHRKGVGFLGDYEIDLCSSKPFKTKVSHKYRFFIPEHFWSKVC